MLLQFWEFNYTDSGKAVTGWRGAKSGIAACTVTATGQTADIRGFGGG
jgi:hypothetical protein